MLTDLVAARQMVRLAASKLDSGDAQATTYCAMAKRFATDAGFRICNDALQLYGGYGYIREYPMERHVRDTRVHQILEGTNEIMRVIIARVITSYSIHYTKLYDEQALHKWYMFLHQARVHRCIVGNPRSHNHLTQL